MSAVWPPPPQNQPASQTTAITPNGSIGAILCVSLGAALLATFLAAYVYADLTKFVYSPTADIVVIVCIPGGLTLLNLGGWIGAYTRRTKNGRAAFALWFVMVIAFSLIWFAEPFLRYL